MLNKPLYAIPMLPTPDANLHLGHAAGPYLSADIFSRWQRQLGRPIRLLGAIDGFENWCASHTPDDFEILMNTYRKAFGDLWIVFDTFETPMSGHFNQVYAATLTDTFKTLVRSRAATERHEKLYHHAETDTFGVGANIKGRCPSCGEAMRGSACINCFHHSQPYELIEASTEYADAEVHEMSSIFYVVDSEKVDDEIQRSLTPDAQRICQHWLSISQGDLRLTYPSNFGIPAPDVPGSVISNTFFQACLALLAHDTNTASGGDLKGSFEVEAFMGLDNVIPSALGSLMLATHLPVMQFRRFHTNHMLYYEGAKFSKSKRHGPTIAQYMTGRSEDERAAVRVFLSRIDLRKGIQNFRETDFQSFTKEYLDLRSRFIELLLREKNLLGEAKTGRGLSSWQGLTGTTSFDRPSLTGAYLATLSKAVHGSRDDLLSSFHGAVLIDPGLIERLEAGF
ncbi:class I tRNA ligase family protein [Rhizobium leguminosarum]|uniref:class I tRNA ligase family protein n=1 Tax=Rhizobium leguminosarum TaxID=384 RepID=UPI003F9C6179